ncbi:MAG: hypothetical protein WKF53_17615 [Rubrobacter sp.]
MGRPAYPQWARREKVLWAVHEWCEERTDARTMLNYDELVLRVGDEAYEGTPTDTGIEFDRQAIDRTQAQVLSLFTTLVNEGYIDAEVKGSSKSGPPWVFASVRGLTGKGLRAIQELPDPNDALMQRLDALAEAVRELRNVPDEEKKPAIDAVEELKTFARGLPPGLAIEFGKAIFGG